MRCKRILLSCTYHRMVCGLSFVCYAQLDVYLRRLNLKNCGWNGVKMEILNKLNHSQLFSLDLCFFFLSSSSFFLLMLKVTSDMFNGLCVSWMNDALMSSWNKQIISCYPNLWVDNFQQKMCIIFNSAKPTSFRYVFFFFWLALAWQ